MVRSKRKYRNNIARTLAILGLAIPWVVITASSFTSEFHNLTTHTHYYSAPHALLIEAPGTAVELAKEDVPPKYDLRKTYHLFLDVNNRYLKGTGQWQLTGYAASDLRSEIAEVIAEGESSELYFQRQFKDLNIDSLEMINPGISTLPVMVNFRLESGEAIEKIDSEYVLQPFKIKDFNDNPFIGESRISDKDFDFPYRVKEKIYITIPPGYEVIGLPKNEQLNVRKQDALIKLDVQHFKNKILLSFDFSIEKPVFKNRDQDILKAIFDKYIAISNSAIVLKKNDKLSSSKK